VAVRQGKAGGAVIELGAEPGVEGMAGVAGLRELCGDVVRIGGLLKIGLMAGIALGREALELADRSALMTIVALHCGVRAQQGETVLMIFELLDGDVPALHGVALRAVGAHLSLVDVIMTILAVLADVGENGFDVALRAGNFFVHSTKGVFGFVVVELRDCADGSPGLCGVAVFTLDGKIAVWAFARAALRSECRGRERQSE
jgi:hypothetical protein